MKKLVKYGFRGTEREVEKNTFVFNSKRFINLYIMYIYRYKMDIF